MIREPKGAPNDGADTEGVNIGTIVLEGLNQMAMEKAECFGFIGKIGSSLSGTDF